MSIPNGVIALQAIGLRPAEIAAAPDRLYLQSPERYEFVDITDLSKRYVISLQTGLYIPFSGLGGNPGITSLQAASDFTSAPIDTANTLVAAALKRKISQIQDWDPTTNTPTLVSGVSPGVNNTFRANVVSKYTLPTAIDGINSVKPGDLLTFSEINGAYVQVPVLPDMSTTDLLDAHVLNEVAISAQTASYTLALTDAGKTVDVNSTVATTITIPTNSSVAFSVGTVIIVCGTGIGLPTIAGAAGVTVLKPAARTLTLSARYESASLTKTASDTWRVVCG